MKRALFCYVVVALLFLLDQYTKQMAEQGLMYAQPVPIFPGLNMTLLYNTGAAFSLFSDAGGWQHWFLGGISALVSLALVIWIARLQPAQHLLAAALTLVLSGALGNLYDRVTLGYVVDFIDVYYRNWHWPAFNVADASICVGAGLLLLDAFFEKDEAGGSND